MNKGYHLDIGPASYGTTEFGKSPESAKLAAFPLFDWLRIVLASIVVLGHEGVSFPRPVDGQLAVEVFFALSGWLIGGILINTNTRELPLFFFNRATRIWIPYAAALVLLYGFAAVYKGIDIFWVKYLFYDVTFTHQVFTHFPKAGFEMPLAGSGNQFWSISVEEQFYLIAPLIMQFRLGRTLAPWIAIAALMLMNSVLGAPIALGVIAAILRSTYGEWHLKSRERILIIIVTCASFILMRFVQSHALGAVFSIGIVLILATPGTRHSASIFLGGISFPMYLNHWLGAFVSHGVTRHIIRASADASLTNFLYVSIAYLSSLFIGTIAYVCIDLQILRRRQSWFTPRHGVTCAFSAYSLVIIGLTVGLFII